MAYTEGAGGVGADKLHHHLFPLTHIGQTKGPALLADGRKHGAPDRRLEKEVHKARSGDFHLIKQALILVEQVHQLSSNLAGVAFFLPGQHHSKVGGKITLTTMSGHFHVIEVCSGIGPEVLFHALLKTLVNQCLYLGSYHYIRLLLKSLFNLFVELSARNFSKRAGTARIISAIVKGGRENTRSGCSIKKVAEV
ncbi:hypothetical protein VT98_14692 [Candidatus Electrothrix communis]|uniref:Uncharacterized protein n=1 Tax=Candidatus Electrothrix communis TaxID=1859133 RepID=A0A444IQ91_9BACT|nr:hypothetical protein VT98_14692 [Candidatus Electrothrix communis]